MLIHVQSFVLNTGRHPKAVKFLDAKEEKEAAGSSPEVDDEDAEALSTEESPAASVESAIGCGEQTCQQSAKDAADTVYGACANRVVDVQDVVNELNGIDKDCTTYQTDDNGTDG